MNNSKAISATTLDQITADISVSMSDVVNVFVERYETGLINKRTSNQNILKDINKQIQSLSDSALASAKQFVGIDANTGAFFSNPLFAFSCSVPEKEFKVDLSIGQVSYDIVIKVKSLSMSTDSYRSSGSDTIGGIFNIDQDIIDQYKGLIDQKANVIAVLSEINTSLRDVSRKERQIRAKLSEQKLVSMNMQDLLTNPEMLMLVDTSSVDDVVG